jgi:hypothetical protein
MMRDNIVTVKTILYRFLIESQLLAWYHQLILAVKNDISTNDAHTIAAAAAAAAAPCVFFGTCLLAWWKSISGVCSSWEFSIIKKQQPLCKMVKRLAQLGSSDSVPCSFLYQLLAPLEAEKAVTSQAPCITAGYSYYSGV